MKKKIFIMLLFILTFFPLIGVSATSGCYKQCIYPMKKGDECSYVSKCTSGGSISCEKVSNTYCGETAKVSCGNITEIPRKIPELTSFGMDLVQVAVPVILIIMGTIDLFKGVTAGKEDEIKKGQEIFIKRLILAALIFFIVVVVKFLISVISDTNKTNIVDCIDCFVSNDC